MDKSVDQDLEAQASDHDEKDPVVAAGSEDIESEDIESEDIESEDIESEDIESELYSSTREAGMGAVAFGPVDGS